MESKRRFDLGDSPHFQASFHSVGEDPPDDASCFSDIACNEGQVACNQGQVVLSLSESPSYSSRISSNSSSKHQVPRKVTKKRGKSKPKNSKLADIDDQRPDSDRTVFEKLQQAKADYRKLKHKFVPGNISNPNTTTMARPSRKKGPANASENAPTESENRGNDVTDHGAGGENVPENGQDLSPIPHGSKRKVNETETHIYEDEEMLNAVDPIWKSLKKLSNEKRMKRVHEILCDKYSQRKQYKAIVDRCPNKIERLQQQKEDLQKSIDVNGQTTQEAAITLRINQEVLKNCKEIAKSKLWRQCKFISDASAEVTAAELVLNRLESVKTKMETSEGKASLIKTYKTEIKKALFGQKNYVASELKKVVWKLLEEGKTLPSTEEILKCAARKISTNDEVTLFMWYWDVLLPKMVGAKEWDTSVRYYTTISSAKDPDEPKDRLITVSDEAMLVLMWDNSYDRWITEWTWETDPENKDNKNKKKPKWSGKYSFSNKGQCKWGGWKHEGYLAYNKYFEEARAARKDKNCKKVEENCLQMLRAKNNITQENHEMQEHMKRRQKRAEKKGETLDVGVTIPLEQHKIWPFIEIDSEEEDDDQDSDEETSEEEE